MSGSTSPSERDDHSAVSQALRETSSPLDTVDPDASLDDLDDLQQLLGSATVVGMGEHSHGTREVFRLKHRLFRYLVEELEFRVLALEANFTATRVVNEYVTEGNRMPEEVLTRDGIHHMWRCESVVDLLEWMRSFNKGRPEDDQIRVYGIDVHGQVPMLEHATSYLETADPGGLTDLEDELRYLRDPPSPDTVDDPSELQRYVETLQTVAATLGTRLEDNEEGYAEQDSGREYSRARHEASLLQKYGEMLSAHLDGDHETVFERRGAGMAETISWIQDVEPGSKIGIWAHNAHIKRGEYRFPAYGLDDVPSLGEHLTRNDDIEYVPVGFSVARGEARFYAERSERFEVASTGELSSESLPGMLSSSIGELVVVELGGLPRGGAVTEWCESAPARHYVYATDRAGPVDSIESNPRSDFDAVVFIPEGTAARNLRQ